MSKIHNSPKETKQKPDDAILNIKDTIQQVNTYLCSAQMHLLSESGKMCAQIDTIELALPTAYRQIIKSDGESEIQKISEVKLPLGSLLPTGMFHISHVEVDLPISIDLVDNQPIKDKDSILDSKKPEARTQATLKLTYQYQPLSKVVTPSIFQATPFVDLKFIDFSLDPKNQRRCTAIGVIEVCDGETGEPLDGAKIFLSVKDGNVMPSVGYLNKKGIIEFRIIGNCQKDGEFNNTMLILINGVTRTFNILLSPEKSGESL
ncbi:MAG: hypothetical protein K8R67_04990 [Desulfobacteraceae bacterium]|nr:hypothetical protein [Desulfobacteraceae bacterium]